MTGVSFRGPGDALALRYLTGTVEVIEPLVEGGGAERYQLLAPRGPNAWVTRVLQDAPVRLVASGLLEFGCDPCSVAVARNGLRGTWDREGQRIRLRASGQMPAASDAWLDGYLVPGDDSDPAWSLDAVFSGGSGTSRVLARVRHKLAASTTRQGSVPPVIPDAPATVRQSRLAPAVSAYGTLQPVFDVLVTVARGFDQAPSRPASLVLSEDDEGRVHVTLACEGPVGVGWIGWADALPDEDAHSAPNRVRVSAPPGRLPAWYAQEEAWPVPLREARLTARYSPADFTIAGTVTAVGTEGTQYSAEIRGRLQSPVVEAMRRDLAQLCLSGSWEGVLGPVATARIPGSARVAGHGDMRASASGELTSPDSGGKCGFLRHDRAQDLAVGLVGPAWPKSLIALGRRDAPLADLDGLESRDATALRFLAEGALIDGLTATARPLLDRAAALLNAETQDDWTSRLILLNYQVQADFELRDYRGLISHLRDAVALQRNLLVDASPWAWARRIAIKNVADCRSTLKAFPPGLARIGAAARVLDSVDQAAAAEPSGTVLAGTATSDLLDALLAALRSATASLRELSEAELAGNQVLQGPDLAPRLAALVEAAGRPLPEDEQQLYQVRADLDRQEEEFVSALSSGQYTSDEQRQAQSSYAVAVVLRSLATRLSITTRMLGRKNLPAEVEQRIASSSKALTSLTGFVERWRSLLVADTDRIQAVEGSQEFYADMVRFLVSLDAPREAFLASELARARAFADLLRKPDRLTAPHVLPAMPTADGLIEACAESRHLVVEYFLLADEAVIWLVTPTGAMTVCRSPVGRTRLSGTIGELHALLTTGNPTPSEQARTGDLLQWLGDQLWQPLPPDLLPSDPDEAIIIVPHGPLFQVPFAALRDSRGRHLAESHALVLAPSAAMLPQLLQRRQGRPPARRACLAMVSPSPMPLPDLRELTQVSAEGFRRIAADFYQPGGSVIHQGTDATLAAFRQDAADADVLIFATHAEALDAPGADPMDSYIVLAPTPDHDGLLHARDVVGMGLSARVAILSACSTGAGRVTGDGVIGLSRAFLAAGPSTLLMTLYETGERTSLDLVYRFHGYWKGDGMTAASALRRVLCELHKEQHGSQPHLWAPFVLFGIDTTLEEP